MATPVSFCSSSFLSVVGFLWFSNDHHQESLNEQFKTQSSSLIRNVSLKITKDLVFGNDSFDIITESSDDWCFFIQWLMRRRIERSICRCLLNSNRWRKRWFCGNKMQHSFLPLVEVSSLFKGRTDVILKQMMSRRRRSLKPKQFSKEWRTDSFLGLTVSSLDSSSSTEEQNSRGRRELQEEQTRFCVQLCATRSLSLFSCTWQKLLSLTRKHEQMLFPLFEKRTDVAERGWRGHLIWSWRVKR